MIKLSKIKFNQLKVIESALSNYDQFLTEFVEKHSVSQETKIFKSICNEILKEVTKKLDKDFLPEHSSLKLQFHKAVVLTNAFLHYQRSLKTGSYEHALLVRYNHALLPQIN